MQSSRWRCRKTSNPLQRSDFRGFPLILQLLDARGIITQLICRRLGWDTRRATTEAGCGQVQRGFGDDLLKREGLRSAIEVDSLLAYLESYTINTLSKDCGTVSSDLIGPSNEHDRLPTV